MAKVILEFDAIEEQDDIQSALNGYKWKLAMDELDNKLRDTTKYGVSHINPTGTLACPIEDKVAERYRDMIREILSGYELTL